MLEDKAISAERRFLRQRERHGCTQEAKYVVVPCSADSQGPDRSDVDSPFKSRKEEKKSAIRNEKLWVSIRNQVPEKSLDPVAIDVT